VQLWEQRFTPQSISRELAAQGFDAIELWQDLEGTPLAPGSGSIGVIARAT